jgi:hypothetical protein
VRDTLRAESPNLLKRLIFRGSVASDYGKDLRWRLETMFGEGGNKIPSRNEIMNAPSDWYADHDPNSTEILHEYFIPSARLSEFLEKMRPICARDKPDLLNICLSHLRRSSNPLRGHTKSAIAFG